MTLREKLSESFRAMILFDLTQSYVMAMVDRPMKMRVKETFKTWFAEGNKLWKFSIDRLKQDGYEYHFDEYIQYFDQAFQLMLDAKDPEMMLAMMKALNENNVLVVDETENTTNEMVITRQLVEEQQRHLHASA